MHIKITDLSKKYYKNKIKCFDNINVFIGEGIYGLLGENGAGKTSLLKTIATIMPIQKGNIEINEKNLNENLQEIREIIGYLPQRFEFFEHMTVYETLEYISLLKNPEQNEESRKEEIFKIIKEFNLNEKIKSKVENLSGGMKQRLAIAQALIGDSKIIILDEPTVGLDPNERLRFRNIINEIAENKIIIISTHIISDIAILCDNVGIMKKGQLLYSGSVEKLLEKVEGKVFVNEISKKDKIDKSIYKNLISIIRKKDLVELRFILKTKENKIFREITPTLEDAYFYMMNCDGEN